MWEGIPHLHPIILPLVPCSIWEGVPHLHPIILPLVPCSIWEGCNHIHPIKLPLVPCPFWGTQVTGTRSLPEGVTLVPGGRVPQSQVERGYACPREGTPWSGQVGVPASQDRMGYPLPLNPPSPGTGYAWTGYAVGGTHLAVSCRRTV